MKMTDATKALLLSKARDVLPRLRLASLADVSAGEFDAAIDAAIDRGDPWGAAVETAIARHALRRVAQHAGINPSA